ncbi:MAG: 50S ribosomal protein L32e [Candidatus Micrarchaeota archaeon]|nr:50S ribosomal protein L32e [Candidatus Micrarchaeota archaeon]
MVVAKKKHPKFFRQNYGRTDMKRVAKGWKRPRGHDNKKRAKHSSAGAEPNIGWRNASAVRDLHPSGFGEALVRNLKELGNVQPGKALRIAAGVGRMKRNIIIAKAKELNFKILNE